jgi:hypothetical protein
MATAWTLTQLSALEEAIAKGVLTVRYQDRWITYRSLDEMFKIRNEMRKALGLTNKGDRLYVKTNKGICQ